MVGTEREGNETQAGGPEGRQGPLYEFKRAKPAREDLGKDGVGEREVSQWLLRKSE